MSRLEELKEQKKGLKEGAPKSSKGDKQAKKEEQEAAKASVKLAPISKDPRYANHIRKFHDEYDAGENIFGDDDRQEILTHPSKRENPFLHPRIRGHFEMRGDDPDGDIPTPAEGKNKVHPFRQTSRKNSSLRIMGQEELGIKSSVRHVSPNKRSTRQWRTRKDVAAFSNEVRKLMGMRFNTLCDEVRVYALEGMDFDDEKPETIPEKANEDIDTKQYDAEECFQRFRKGHHLDIQRLLDKLRTEVQQNFTEQTQSGASNCEDLLEGKLDLGELIANMGAGSEEVPNENRDSYKEFHQWAPLWLYSNLDKATNRFESVDINAKVVIQPKDKGSFNTTDGKHNAPGPKILQPKLLDLDGSNLGGLSYVSSNVTGKTACSEEELEERLATLEKTVVLGHPGEPLDAQLKDLEARVDLLCNIHQLEKEFSLLLAELNVLKTEEKNIAKWLVSQETRIEDMSKRIDEESAKAAPVDDEKEVVLDKEDEEALALHKQTLALVHTSGREKKETESKTKDSEGADNQIAEFHAEIVPILKETLPTLEKLIRENPRYFSEEDSLLILEGTGSTAAAAEGTGGSTVADEKRKIFRRRDLALDKLDKLEKDLRFAFADVHKNLLPAIESMSTSVDKNKKVMESNMTYFKRDRHIKAKRGSAQKSVAIT